MQSGNVNDHCVLANVVLTIFPMPRDPPVIRTTLPATANNDSVCRELIVDNNWYGSGVKLLTTV